MSSGPSPYVQFGPFECDRQTGELTRDGRLIKLQEQPRQILVALLERPGVLVSRDDLRRRLWRDDTYVDFDNALNVGVRKIREAIGDVAPTARYVETVRGQGYQFIAPVSSRVASPLTSGPATETVVPFVDTPQSWWRTWQSLTAAATIILVIGIAAIVVRPWARGDRTIDSLAVIPLQNLLGDESHQYLVDGLTEAVTTELSARLRLRVISIESASQFKGRTSGLAEIGRALGVDALLVGSVARSGGAGLVVNVRLVEAATDRNRWGGRFERSSTDDLVFSDDIVGAIAANVSEATLAPLVTRERPRIVSPEARNAYLRGRFFWTKRGQNNSVTAVEYLSAALQLQGDYAEAWSALADVYATYTGAPSPVIVPWPGNPTDAGMMAAREALRLSPNLGDAHAALGKLYTVRGRWAEAEASLRRGVELSPQYSTARQWLGTLYMRLRRCDEARTQVEIGAKLDPLTQLVNQAVGGVYANCGAPELAVPVLESVLKMHPDANTTHYVLGRVLVRLGRVDEGIRHIEIAHRPGDETFATCALMHAYVKAGRLDDARRMLAGIQRNNYVRAAGAASLGDTALMFEQLEQAIAHHSTAFPNLLIEPAFEPYFGDPRFVDIARRVGFPVPIPSAQFTDRRATPQASQ